MIKIIHDDERYWYPDDREEFERLFGQHCSLRINSRAGLSKEECQKRDAEAEVVEAKIAEIVARQVPIKKRT